MRNRVLTGITIGEAGGQEHRGAALANTVAWSSGKRIHPELRL